MIDIIMIIISGILLGLLYISNKLLSKYKYHPATFTAVYSLFCAILISPFAFYQFKIPSSVPFWILSILSPLGFGLSFLFGYKAYKLAEASSVGLISRTSLVFAAAIGVILLGEHYTSSSYLGLLLVFIGSLIIVYEKKRIIIEKGTIYALIMAFGYGAVAVMDKKILEEFSPLTYVLFNNLIIFTTFSLFKTTRKEMFQLIRKHPKLTIASSFVGVTSWALFLIIIQKASVSIMYPIWESIALIVTVAIGIMCLNEKEKVPQKILGVIVTILGISLLG